MKSEFAATLASIGLAIIGLAALAVVLSGKSTTLGVIQNSAVGLANDIGAADAPVTGTFPTGLTFAQSSTYS